MPNTQQDISSSDVFSEFRTKLAAQAIFSPEHSERLGGVLKSSSGTSIYLRHYHTFGRSSACNTSIVRNDISRLHFIVFWKHDRWYIQDKSTNGVWVNDQKLILNHARVLEPSDVIAFSCENAETYCMLENHEPCDLMMGIEPDVEPIYLEKPITVFSEDISFVYKGHGWNMIVYQGDKKETSLLKDGDLVQIQSNTYRLQANHQEYETHITRPTAKSINDLQFCFDVSADDEDIQLNISGAGQCSVIKGVRLQSQLYLMLCLARKAIADTSQGYTDAHCGWIEVDDLSKMLRIKPENTRIRLHRLRTRLREMINFDGIDACEILQLQDKEVRFHTSNITVIKGGKPEQYSG